jgi:hypothetical protein
VFDEFHICDEGKNQRETFRLNDETSPSQQQVRQRPENRNTAIEPLSFATRTATELENSCQAAIQGDRFAQELPW